MKIHANRVEQNYSQKKQLNFKAGLTLSMLQEINSTDVKLISKELKQKDIDSDFKENKIIAWCSRKSVEIFEHINKNYNSNLLLPKGIFVENFSELNVKPTLIGFCNFTRSLLKKTSKEASEPATIFFNSNHEWNSINEIADLNYKNHMFATNIFLHDILHEFSHVAHEGQLLNRFSVSQFINKLDFIQQNEVYLKNYRNKYKAQLKTICDYSLINPLEAIACDFTRTIANSLNKEALLPAKDPFYKTSYGKLPFFNKLFNTAPSLDADKSKILKRFWNGDFN